MIILLAISLALWLVIFVFINRHVSVDPEPYPAEKPMTSLAVLIAARNEAGNIERCLRSIAAQTDLPASTQIIVVNDHSEDGTPGVVHAFQAAHPHFDIQVVSLSDTHGKKAALKAGLAAVRSDHLYLTDADCTLTQTTVSQLYRAMEEKSSQVAFGPVLYTGRGLFQRLLVLENLNNQLVTEAFLNFGKPVMANAANMMLHRSVFPVYLESLERPGASGDDVFFVQQLKREQYVPCYFPPFAVWTDAPAGLRALVRQRTRWATKSRDYDSWLARGFALSVGLINAIFTAALFSALFFERLRWPVVLLFMARVAVEFACHRYWFRKYHVYHNLLQALVLSCTYSCYVTIIGILSVIGTGFEWKGRYHNT